MGGLCARWIYHDDEHWVDICSQAATPSFLISPERRHESTLFDCILLILKKTSDCRAYSSVLRMKVSHLGFSHTASRNVSHRLFRPDL